VSIAATTVMVAGSLTGYATYRGLAGEIKQKPINGDIINPRPRDTGALNVLLVGSDTRAGKGNAQYGQEQARMVDAGGKRTDTIILLHISPNRDSAQLISFPRDSMVQIPKCKNEATKQEMPPRRDMINSAYNLGGIACTISTLETLTQIRINHFVEIDFSGFKNIVDALGGIEMCFKSGVNDKDSKLVLPPGKSLLMGEQALGYVRLRKYGDGSDLQRIKRQQIFLSKVIAKATSNDLFSDPSKLTSFIRAAAQSVTMDPGLANNPQKLIDIALSAEDLTANGVDLTTVPLLPDPEDENRVIWRNPDAETLFAAIRSDTEMPEAEPSTSAKPKVTVKPEQVQVQVLNGTTTKGKAREVADLLTKQGFKVTQLGNYQTPDGQSLPATEIRYPKTATSGADYAGVLAGQVLPKPAPAAGKAKATTTEPYYAPSTTTAGTETGTAKKAPVVQLIVGADFKSVKVTELPDSVKDSTIKASEQKNVCV
jgi:LCP family protein required for cell wall assembly